MIHKGVLKSFNSTTYKSTVQIVGSLNVWLSDVPTSHALASADMIAGRHVAVLTPDPGKPGDSVVVALWSPSTPPDPVSTDEIHDADNDTKIQVEESSDEDKIRMDVAGVEAFLLSDVGILTLAKQSGVSVYLSANQVIPTAVNTLVMFDTESYDVQNEFDSSVVSGTATATTANKLVDAGKFTEAAAYYVGRWVWNTTDNTYAVVTGKDDDNTLSIDTDIMANGEGYILYLGKITFAEAGKYIVTCLLLFQNMADQASMRGYVLVNGSSIYGALTAASGTSYNGINISTTVNVSANDYLQIKAYQSSGSDRNLYGATPFRTSIQITKLT